MVKFSKTVTETITIENLKLNSNWVFVNEFFFNFHDILYTVEKLLKSVFNGNVFEHAG